MAGLNKKIKYSELFLFVEEQTKKILGYSEQYLLTSRSTKFVNFYIDVCYPIVFGSVMGEPHIRPLLNKWHDDSQYRAFMFFIMQQISLYIADNDGDWDEVVDTAVNSIIIPDVTKSTDVLADKVTTLNLFRQHGWLFAAWVMQNTVFRRVVENLHALERTKE